MASTSSLGGPFGPVRRPFGENNNRHFRLRRIRWNSRIVDGLSTMAVRINRDGRMNSAHRPDRIRSEALRFGARCRSIEYEHLLLDQQSFGDNRTQTAGAQKPSQRRNVVDQQDNRVTHGHF